MAAFSNDVRFPRPPRISSGYGEPSLSKYDEVWFDPNTLTYKTRHQEEQIRELKEQLENKKKEREKSLKSIIGYFYKKTL